MRHEHSAGRPTGSVASALFGIAVFLLACAPALADFSGNMQTGLDNAQFQFFSYTYENAGEFYFVTGEGADGDAVRSGPIGSTYSSSAESGVYFNVTGPGTIKFRWKMSGQTVVNGKGAILQYNMWDPNDYNVPYVTAYITGVQDWQEVTIPVPAASRQIIITYVRSYGSSAVGADAGWVDQLTWTPAGGSDTTPDAFGFTPLADAPPATAMTSNIITVAGINAAAAISIDSCTGTNCGYSVNSAAFTSAAGTVSNGSKVQVRQTSSASPSTATTLTLNIGGVKGAYTVTTGPDMAPDPYSFTAQSNVALSTAVTSNTITVSGIEAPATINIGACTGSNCGISVNGGVFFWAGTVSNGDKVRVRQTSSASYSTTTELTLNIGGVTGTFDVTTMANPTPISIAEGQTPTGTGIAKASAGFAGNASPDCHVSQAAFLSAPVPPPAGVTLPHGMFGFSASGCTSNFSVNVTVEYPSAIPAGASYWKYDAAKGWFTIPATVSGNKVSFTIADNGPGDANAALGAITDPGGIGLGQPLGAEAPIPTLSQWGLLALTGLLGLMGWFAMQRRRG